MSSFSGKKQDSKKQSQIAKKIDFNDEDSVKDVLSQISKNSKSGSKNVAERLITFFSSHVALTAVIAVYLIVSGIVGNIYAICNLIF